LIKNNNNDKLHAGLLKLLAAQEYRTEKPITPRTSKAPSIETIFSACSLPSHWRFEFQYFQGYFTAYQPNISIEMKDAGLYRNHCQQA
jgi:hypothetical protein